MNPQYIVAAGHAEFSVRGDAFSAHETPTSPSHLHSALFSRVVFLFGVTPVERAQTDDSHMSLVQLYMLSVDSCGN